jgi:hypothetical protein
MVMNELAGVHEHLELKCKAFLGETLYLALSFQWSPKFLIISLD